MSGAGGSARALSRPAGDDGAREAVRGLLSHTWRGEKHLVICRVGLWVDGYSGGDGAPCSDRCRVIREWLGEAVPVQPRLLLEAS
jgi:hypothetical protein